MKSDEEIKNTPSTRNAEPDLDVLIESAISGDEKAFRQLYDLYAGKMYSLCKRYLGNNSDADDVFQDAYIKVFKGLRTYQGHGTFDGWMRRIFINTCLDHLKRRNNGLLVAVDVENKPALHPVTDGHINAKLTNNELLKAIQQIPVGHRIIINLYLVEGYSHKEISDLLHISEGTSKSQLSRAKHKLKEIMGNI